MFSQNWEFRVLYLGNTSFPFRQFKFYAINMKEVSADFKESVMNL